jgi:hypothetical protein
MDSTSIAGFASTATERMNSPLEIREVRLRGLHRGRSPASDALVRRHRHEQVSPQRARGFTCSNPARVHSDGVRQELSAQADIAVSEPRFQSPWLEACYPALLPRSAEKRGPASSRKP